MPIPRRCLAGHSTEEPATSAPQLRKSRPNPPRLLREGVTGEPERLPKGANARTPRPQRESGGSLSIQENCKAEALRTTKNHFTPGPLSPLSWKGSKLILSTTEREALSRASISSPADHAR